MVRDGGSGAVREVVGAVGDTEIFRDVHEPGMHHLQKELYVR